MTLELTLDTGRELTLDGRQRVQHVIWNSRLVQKMMHQTVACFGLRAPPQTGLHARKSVAELRQRACQNPVPVDLKGAC
jgi:hypothetical protein